MSALKSVLLALSITLVTPVMVHATGITLIPAVKLQIGDQDQRGNYWDGARWHDRDSWERDYEWHDNGWHKRGNPHGKNHDNGNHGNKHNKHNKHD